jgi:uncharacterized protein
LPWITHGCSQQSDEEARLVAALVENLLQHSFIDRSGREASIGLENILVVAPYNLQVNLTWSQCIA